MGHNETHTFLSYCAPLTFFWKYLILKLNFIEIVSITYLICVLLGLVMVRNKVRKTTNGTFSAEDMEETVSLVKNQKYSIRGAAKLKNLKFQTVHR